MLSPVAWRSSSAGRGGKPSGKSSSSTAPQSQAKASYCEWGFYFLWHVGFLLVLPLSRPPPGFIPMTEDRFQVKKPRRFDSSKLLIDITFPAAILLRLFQHPREGCLGETDERLWFRSMTSTLKNLITEAWAAVGRKEEDSLEDIWDPHHLTATDADFWLFFWFTLRSKNKCFFLWLISAL